MRLRLLLVVLALSGCLGEYTILSGGETEAMPCPPGQVPCDGAEGACVPAGTCDPCPTDPASCEECPDGQEKCGDACVAMGTCECVDQCPTELENCEQNTCMCREGLVRCGDECVDVRANPHHCAICDHVCEAGKVCQGTHCIDQCDADRLLCGGACVDAHTDSLNCGVCGKLCQGDEVCMSGECRHYTALPGCFACPCSEACQDGGICCDSPFLISPVCLAEGC